MVVMVMVAVVVVLAAQPSVLSQGGRISVVSDGGG